MSGNSVVVKVSGKLVSPENTSLLSAIISVLRDAWREGVLRAVVIGGGRLSRDYISAAGRLGAGKALQDVIGIEASRLKARLVAAALWPDAFPEPPRSIWEVLEASATGKLVVVGGLQPGQSTATVAAIVAEALGAGRLVVASTVDGVYDKDPEKYSDARLLSCIDYDGLLKVLASSLEPGRYELLDPYAISLLRRSNIETIIVNGRRVERIRAAIRGEPSRYTVVKPLCRNPS